MSHIDRLVSVSTWASLLFEVYIRLLEPGLTSKVDFSLMSRVPETADILVQKRTRARVLGRVLDWHL